jgi:hypothetical protein
MCVAVCLISLVIVQKLGLNNEVVCSFDALDNDCKILSFSRRAVHLEICI